jgi:sec-independent protein translocase protein TatC
LATNQFQNVELTPIPVVTASETNYVIGLALDTNSPATSGTKIPTELAIFSPAGGFMVAFQVAIYGGIVLASPFLIFFIGQFVVPAMKIKEKRYVYRGFAIGSVLFLAGVSFCYFVLLRYALAASYMYSTWEGFASPQWRAEEYISFVCKFMLGMGIGFEQPVVLLALVKIGVLDYAKLKAFRKYMIVINLILGAVLTTPEVVTQILLAVPLQILYEITIWVAWYWERQDRKRQEKEGLL